MLRKNFNQKSIDIAPAVETNKEYMYIVLSKKQFRRIRMDKRFEVSQPPEKEKRNERDKTIFIH